MYQEIQRDRFLNWVRFQVGYLDIDDRIILKYTLKKQGLVVNAVLEYLRMKFDGNILWWR
jgi:hypothetical protein